MNDLGPYGVNTVVPPCKKALCALFLLPVKQEPHTSISFLEGKCGQPKTCPLSQVQAGATVCIKELFATPDVKERLREMGFCEEQRIRVLARQSNFICQVCNARLGISDKLADAIMVEPLPKRRH